MDQAGSCFTCSPYCSTWTFSSVTSSAPHHRITHRQESLDLLLGVDDLDDQRTALGHVEDLRRVEASRMAEARLPAKNRGARQVTFPRFRHERLVEPAPIPGPVVLADEDAQERGVARKRRGSSSLIRFDERSRSVPRKTDGRHNETTVRCSEFGRRARTACSRSLFGTVKGSPALPGHARPCDNGGRS